ncbi:MAG: NADPH:quinone reductase [Rhodospirillales bacterium]|nr:NADPH:quinone reductase [Rhodospirillales bacterium]
MQAAWYSEFGPAKDVLQVGKMDIPEPDAGEVRVRIAVSGINPVDVKRRQGGRGEMPAPRVVPHFDGAGTIDKVGPGGPEDRVGERVWLFEANWQRSMGTAAGFACLPADRAIRLPDSAGFDDGACLGIPALTAHACVFSDGSVEGQTVLVTGGTGSVGGYAVQFASLAGATVIATVGNDEKKDLATAMGASHVVNYKTEDVVSRIADITGGAGVDRIVEVEFGGNLETSLQIIKTNGVLAAYASDAVLEPKVPFYRLVYGNLTVRHVLVFLVPDGLKKQGVQDIGRWLSEGKLKHHIGGRFALDEIAAAHEAVAKGSFGKVLIDIPSNTPV